MFRSEVKESVATSRVKVQGSGELGRREMRRGKGYGMRSSEGGAVMETT
jgi:hypothetical protein